MKENTKPSVILAAGALMLSLSFIAAGATLTFADGVFPTNDAPVNIGGSSSITTPPTPGASPTPTPPNTGGNQFPSGPSSAGSGAANLGATSVYCANVQTTILASGSNVGSVLKFFTCFIQSAIIPLLFMLALAVFVWGVVKFMMAQQSAEKEDGKQFMLWGVIAIAVMFSIWGLVNIFQNTFQVKNAVPQLTVPSGS